MIRVTDLPKELKARLTKLPVDGALEVLTYKRNRGFIIWKEADERYLFRELGYQQDIIENLDETSLYKVVQTVVKREFPRSTKLRIYTHEPGAMRLMTDHPLIRI